MNKNATIISGPQGSGKTMRARAIASAIGRFREISWSQLSERFGLADLVDIDAVIIDEVPADEIAMRRVKSLITSDTLRVNRKHAEPLYIPTPHFIFLTGADLFVEESRHCAVIRL